MPLSRKRSLVLLTALGLAVAALLAVATAVTAHRATARYTGASAAAKRAVTLERPLPSLVRIGQRIQISGHATSPPAGAEAVLQLRTTGPWQRLASGAVASDGNFSLRWTVAGQANEPVILRVALVKGKRVLVTTKPVHSAVGPAAVKCATPVPPAVNIPVGDGWIEGGLYIRGGPFPGLDECQSSPYTITATDNATGHVVATQPVAGGHSYTLVVPAGTYSLKANQGCPGIATNVTVTAGKLTMANAYCDVP